MGDRVKYNAFLPSPNKETSVYRISTLTRDEIWDIGKRSVAEVRCETLRGRADIITLDVLKEDLKVKPNIERHPLHANIIGWPAIKHEQKLIAIKLAEKARLHLATL